MAEQIGAGKAMLLKTRLGEGAEMLVEGFHSVV
jgi:hypothetical protein